MNLAFRTATDASERAHRGADEARERDALLAALRADIQQACLTPDSDRSWFIGTDETDDDQSIDTLRLVTRSHRVPLRALESEDSWESQTRHADWSAVTYGMAPATDEQPAGLFRRELLPPGTDPLEEVGETEILSAEVSGVNFRYFDGTEWQDSWDTQNQNAGTLPKAVEVTLTLGSEQEGEEPRTLLAAFPIRLGTGTGTETTVTTGGGQ